MEKLFELVPPGLEPELYLIAKYVEEVHSDLPGDPLVQLAKVDAIHQQASVLIARFARDAIHAGFTYQEVGDVLGITRQRAFQRYSGTTTR